ncbi:MAG TPA: TetR family transcriptional regulator [Bryobacteraceae bacterium]|nr:TetR family transcriptional regulator [Bryobacteraceae bacterium]
MNAVLVDTKTRILEAAEKLFGSKGFDATSLRDITAEAEVNLAAVNYHFQTKDSLIDAVIARRIDPINRRRLALLAAAGEKPTIEQLVEAFVAPVVEQDAPPMLAMMGRAMANPDLFLPRIFKSHLREVADRFGAAFERAAPELSAAERMWRLMFMAGSMAHVLSWGHIVGAMTDGVCDASDRKDVTARLVRFVAAGFRAPESDGAVMRAKS